MSYRPKGWEDPYTKPGNVHHIPYGGFSVPDLSLAYEAGADALLTSLQGQPAIRLSNTLETIEQYVIKIKDLPDGVWRVLLIPE